MATTGTSSPGNIIAKTDALEAGTTKNIVGKATVNVAGTAMTATQLNAKLGTADTLYGAVTSARTALKTALAAWEAALPGLRTFIDEYEAALKGLFGPANPQLEDFGISPKKPPAARSVAEKAVSVALAAQTRAVRGPTTKKSRAQITTQGKPGLVLVSSTGTPIPGGIAGPIPPGGSKPVDAAASLVSVTSPSDGSTASGAAAAPSSSGAPAGK